MEQNEIITALHAQLKEVAQRIFAGLDIKPGKYNAGDVDKALKLSEQLDNIAILRHESREHPAVAERHARKIDDIMINIECSGVPNEVITISYYTFRASMPAAMVFAKLVEWEKTFKIKTADKAVFVKEEEGEVIGSCVVGFPKEAKYAAEYAGTDSVRPVCMGVYLDIKNSCIVATDTHAITEYPVIISDIEGEPLNLIIDPKIIKAVAGQRCEVKLIKDTEKNISIKTEKGDVYTCENIKCNYPDYRRVYPKVNRAGLVELTKEGAKALENFAKSTVKQTKDTRYNYIPITIKIEIPAYSSTGKATYYDRGYQAEKVVEFALKGSPRVDIVFGIHAFHLAIAAKNWTGCFWYADPSRPIVFDHIKSTCTVVMPRTLTEDTAFAPGSCAGVVDTLERHSYAVAEADAIRRRQAEEERSREESDNIPRCEKEESAIRYVRTKGAGYMFDELTATDEIIAVTPNGCKARYVGRFRRSGEIIIFDCKENYISIPEPPKEEPETPRIPTESAETKEVLAEEEKREKREEKREETPAEPLQGTGTDGRHDIPPKPKETNGNVPAAPPGPPKIMRIISGPPGFKFIITPTPNHQFLKLRNHDRHNCLAPPHHHNRVLRLPGIPSGSGRNLRHLRARNPCVMAFRKTYRQVGEKESRGSP